MDRVYKVSIVSAVYNVEKYLEEMIDSIIMQTIGFENIQLILVDDGSSDESGRICDLYSLKYPDNIITIHKKNGGVSSARNEGLKYIRGEYVNFTDADDMLQENALELMYEYLRENEEWIDLVAIRTKFFGARGGKHPLDYKFSRTRIVDLKKEYKCIQLAVNATLAKRECFTQRRFDTQLAQAEDAKMVVDILLDKMRYGIVCGTNYLYRKRDAGDSAIDSSGNRACYYNVCLERFMLYLLDRAKERKGYLPSFVQYTCMYDLQWRLKKNPLVNVGVLTKEEEEHYKFLLIKILNYIDNHIILEQNNIGNNYKMAILLLKEENQGRKEFELCPQGLRICINDIASAGVSDYFMTFEFINFLSDIIEIEGHVRYFAELDDPEVIFKSEGDNEVLAEYKAEFSERVEKCTFCMDKVITQAKGFKFRIKRDEMPPNLELQLYLRYQDRDMLCKNITFGEFFPLGKQLKSSYLFYDGILLSYSGSTLRLAQEKDKKLVKKCEKLFLKEMRSKKNKRLNRAWLARKIYHFLNKLKKKEIWLISDRLTKADDNGEAFFTYMNTIGKQKNIMTFFVLDKKNEDYKRLSKIGKVVAYHSTKHKILSLLCDKIISSQADGYVFNRFFDLAYLYKDIRYRQKIIFLQHGVTQNDLSGWLAKANKNISLFITTTHDEYQSILDYDYYYDEMQVKCTGFPRYDYLYTNADEKNVITFMPTWRKYLAGNINLTTDSRELKGEFENTEYCKMYRQVFSDERLYEAAKKYHYTFKLMLHPAMPRECAEYFKCGSNVDILEKNTHYKELYADSKLIITDYSSAVFDFAYLRKPVLYFQQDIGEFYSGGHICDRGYFNYEKDGFGEVEYTAEGLVNRIIEYMQNNCRLKDVYRERIEKTFPYHDKDSCKRVYEEIIKL